jgi:hypothetical protein
VAGEQKVQEQPLVSGVRVREAKAQRHSVQKQSTQGRVGVSVPSRLAAVGTGYVCDCNVYGDGDGDGDGDSGSDGYGGDYNTSRIIKRPADQQTRLCTAATYTAIPVRTRTMTRELKNLLEYNQDLARNDRITRDGGQRALCAQQQRLRLRLRATVDRCETGGLLDHLSPAARAGRLEQFTQRTVEAVRAARVCAASVPLTEEQLNYYNNVLDEEQRVEFDRLSPDERASRMELVRYLQKGTVPVRDLTYIVWDNSVPH